MTRASMPLVTVGTRRVIQPASIYAQVTGSAETWTPENQNINLALFDLNGIRSWDSFYARWVTPVMPFLLGLVVTHACVQPRAADQAYFLNDHAADFLKTQVGDFSSPVDPSRHMVYPGGLYNPSAHASADIVKAMTYFGAGLLSPGNLIGVDNFAGLPENITQAGANWAPFRRNTATFSIEPWYPKRFACGPKSLDYVVRTEAEYHRNGDTIPDYSNHDDIDHRILCFIDDLPENWSAMVHHDREEWMLAKAITIALRNPAHVPTIPAINLSPDTGQSITPSVIRRYELWRRGG